jgi:hypothetical protein
LTFHEEMICEMFKNDSISMRSNEAIISMNYSATQWIYNYNHKSTYCNNKRPPSLDRSAISNSSGVGDCVGQVKLNWRDVGEKLTKVSPNNIQALIIDHEIIKIIIIIIITIIISHWSKYSK